MTEYTHMPMTASPSFPSDIFSAIMCFFKFFLRIFLFHVSFPAWPFISSLSTHHEGVWLTHQRPYMYSFLLNIKRGRGRDIFDVLALIQISSSFPNNLMTTWGRNVGAGVWIPEVQVPIGGKRKGDMIHTRGMEEDETNKTDRIRHW